MQDLTQQQKRDIASLKKPRPGAYWEEDEYDARVRQIMEYEEEE